MTITDEELFVLFDFEAEVSCDYPRCDNEAEWRLVRRCCGEVFLVCTPCWEETKKWINTVAEVRAGLNCVTCKAKIPVKCVEDAYSVIEKI